MASVIKTIIFIIVVWLLVTWIDGFGTYESLSAEEWADEYYAESYNKHCGR